MKLGVFSFFFFVFLQFSCGSGAARKVDSLEMKSEAPYVKYPLTRDVDSLKVMVRNSCNDSNKVNLLIALSKAMFNSNGDTVQRLCAEGFAISDSLHWEKGMGATKAILGIFKFTKGDYPAALEFHKASTFHYTKASNKAGLATEYGNIGLIYSYQGEYVSALQYYFNALKIDGQLGDSLASAIVLDNIGSVYKDQEDYTKARLYLFRALRINEKAEAKEGLARNFGNIGVSYFQEGDNINCAPSKKDSLLNLALEWYKKSLTINQALGRKNSISRGLDRIALVYLDKKEFASAKDYFLQSLSLAQETRDIDHVTILFANISSLYSEQKKFEEAANYMFKALAINDSIGAKLNLKYNYDYLSELYSTSTIPLKDTIGGKQLSMNQMKARALYYYKKYVAMKDSIFSEENTKLFVKYELNYEFDKKQTADSITNAEQLKHEQLKHDQEIQQQRLYTLGGGIGFALMLIVAGVSIRAYRNKQKANDIISLQKALVEEKQKEILDSIHYAKRIQQSLLPTEKYILNTLKRLRS